MRQKRLQTEVAGDVGCRNGDCGNGECGDGSFGYGHCRYGHSGGGGDGNGTMRASPTLMDGVATEVAATESQVTEER